MSHLPSHQQPCVEASRVGEAATSTPSGESDTSYRRAVEYLQIYAHDGQGSLEVAASNHYPNGKKHRPGTPTDEDLQNAAFLNITTLIRHESEQILRTLSGWRPEEVLAVRPTLRQSFGRRFVHQEFAGETLHRVSWNAVSALLHLRGWQIFRDIEDGFLDLYITPSSHHPWEYPQSPDDYSDEVADHLTPLVESVLPSLKHIARWALDDPTVDLRCSRVRWEEEGTPESGANSYHFTLVVVDAVAGS